MKKRIYIETSVISYLTARPNPSLVLAAHQLVTREWWDEHVNTDSLYISDLVVNEASVGAVDAVARRTELLQKLPRLKATAQAELLASKLVSSGAVPESAKEDAAHIAIAAVHGMDYLLTWNCKHIANIVRLRQVYAQIEDMQYMPPIICTPEDYTEE